MLALPGEGEGFLTLFNDNDGDTKDVLDWLSTWAQPFLHAGLLHVFVARDMVYWHCSIAKNTSHVAAAVYLKDYLPKEIFMVSCDCDNGFSADFVPACVGYASVGWAPIFVQFKGDDGGVTGRMGYWCSTFFQVNGYDEDIRGSGYEDIDLRNRCRALTGHSVVHAINDQHRKFSAGWSFPNDPSGDMKKSLNEAKILHCDPADVQGKSWGSMNGRNMNQAHKNPKLERNPGKRPFDLGCSEVFPWTPGAVFPGLPATSSSGDGVPASSVSPPAIVSGTVILRPRVMFSWGSWSKDERAIALPEGETVFRGLGFSHITLRFVSMGACVAADIFGGSDARRISDQACRRGVQPQIDEQALCRVLAGHYRLDGPQKIIPIDCRLLRDVTGGDRWHVGWYPQNVHIFVHHHHFSTWLATAMRTISETLMREAGDGVPAEYWVVCYCRKGKHRSVAGTLVLGHLLQAMTVACKVGPDLHTSQRLLWSRMCGCPPCQACCRPDAKRSAALKQARIAFRDLLSPRAAV